MVLLLKQVHLQKEVGAEKVSWEKRSSIRGQRKRDTRDVQAARVRARKVESA